MLISPGYARAFLTQSATVVLLGGVPGGIYRRPGTRYYTSSTAGIAESQFARSPRTPKVQNPASRAGSAIFYRSRKEVLLMYLLMLFVFLALVRKRPTKLKIKIDL